MITNPILNSIYSITLSDDNTNFKSDIGYISYLGKYDCTLQSNCHFVSYPINPVTLVPYTYEEIVNMYPELFI